MRDVLPEIERWRAAGERVALATVVSVAGSAPRAVGATLAVSERGEIAGSVSGGCVEPDVIEHAHEAIRTGRPTLLSYGITEEQNVEQIGLSCGGEIRVFVERLDGQNVEPLILALRRDEPVVRAVVISGQGRPDSLFGTTLVLSRGVVHGNLAGGEAPDADDAAEDALALALFSSGDSLLARGESTTRTLTVPEVGEVEVFFSVSVPPPTLVIVGAGHITIPLTRLAKVLGYRTIVVDAREAFATRERLPEADELLVEWPDEALAHVPLSGAAAIAVLTHDEKFDVPALAAALRSPAGYVGAIGSRGTRERRDARLREEGITDEQIGRIHGPIGLDIGAKSPEEIALAILGEVVAVRHGRGARTVVPEQSRPARAG